MALNASGGESGAWSQLAAKRLGVDVSVWVTLPRCAWAETELLAYYHDVEWGTRPTSDAAWLEAVVLETMQAGLSWRTVLEKRPAIRSAFHDFAVVDVAAMTTADVEQMLDNPQLIRHRGKLQATLENAGVAARLITEYGSLTAFFTTLAQSGETAMYKELSRRFRFVGPTTAQSIAQATGLVNAHHDASCSVRHGEIVAQTGF